MLPTKIRNSLQKEFGNRYYQFPPNSIMKWLGKYEPNEDNLMIATTFPRTVTKIVYKNPDGGVVTEFTDNTDTKDIIRIIRNNSSLNYHDYYTFFRFSRDHPIYDLIVEVLYRYVYS